MKCFAAADRSVDRLIRLLKIVHEGFWLGWLNSDELNAVTSEHFDHSQFYSSNSHNRIGLFDWEQEALSRFFRPGSHVLVAGAGAGREVLALRKSGFEAEGFECSPALVEASQRLFDELGESNYVVYCPPDSVPPGSPLYNALIVGWGAYTHIPTRARRIRFLQAFGERAFGNAPLLLSFFTRKTGSRDDVLVYRLARLCSLFSPARKASLDIGDRISYARYIHSFTEQELAEELKAAGVRLAQFVDKGEFGYAVGIPEEAPDRS
ncbi:MAG: hypothetical protein WAM79_14420 [Candidatus Sulfotelmatobacter sp.]